MNRSISTPAVVFSEDFLCRSVQAEALRILLPAAQLSSRAPQMVPLRFGVEIWLISRRMPRDLS